VFAALAFVGVAKRALILLDVLPVDAAFWRVSPRGLPKSIPIREAADITAVVHHPVEMKDVEFVRAGSPGRGIPEKALVRVLVNLVAVGWHLTLPAAAAAALARALAFPIVVAANATCRRAGIADGAAAAAD
jgi:hypothetical protein